MQQYRCHFVPWVLWDQGKEDFARLQVQEGFTWEAIGRASTVIAFRLLGVHCENPWKGVREGQLLPKRATAPIPLPQQLGYVPDCSFFI